MRISSCSNPTASPTYHFAHAVDDHLMRTTLVIRGDEWLSSVPKHLQLFRLLGFKAPKYAHVSPILKEDGGGKRKLSKRKDPEAAMHFYAEKGYPVEGVREYLMTVANSDYEEWRKHNPDASRGAFPFSLRKMSVSGALFDLDKLSDVCKNVIARMDAPAVTGHIRRWAERYDPAFSRLLEQDPDYAESVFSIDRGGPKPPQGSGQMERRTGICRLFLCRARSGRSRLSGHPAERGHCRRPGGLP